MKHNATYYALGMLLVSCAVLGAGCSKTPAAAATKKNIHFGTAMNVSDVLDPAMAEFLHTNFNTIVAENSMKWEHLRPTAKFWNWVDPDKMADFAVAHHMNMRGHTFVWHSQNPGYVNNIKTKEAALEAISTQIVTAMEHFKGRIYEYDVANEIFNEDGTLRESRWLQLIGPEYVEFAFRTARGADPQARLILNDYNNEAAGHPKADAMYNFVKDLVARGVPVDGVGFQLHLATDYEYSGDAIRENIRRYHELGLKVSFTEIDVRMPLPASEEHKEKQLFIYKDLMDMALTEPNVDTFVVWGYSDKNSWVPRAFSGYGSASIFDGNMNPKPVFTELVKMLQ